MKSRRNTAGHGKSPWLLTLILTAGALFGAPPAGTAPECRTLRFVQDDAQDKMVSRIFTLKYLQANDIAPFVTGMVKRYNMNSTVSCFSYVYGREQQQILAVTTPARMMACVAEFLDRADRKITVEGKVPSEILRGTGIARGVYRPRFRSGQVLVDLIVNGLINAGPYSSLYGYDANSNQIYWKDNASNTAYVYQFLSYLDRPPPQIRMRFSICEIRESDLRDVGVDYLAWKNGPGLNLLQAAFRVTDLSSAGSAALQSFSGPLGGFFFAPQFDASFIRLLEQSGTARNRSTGELTVSNSDARTYTFTFNPGYQNIVKNGNDRTSVTGSALSTKAEQLTIKVINPVVCVDNDPGPEFSIAPYFPGENAGSAGVLSFGYEMTNSGAMERNNFGTELICTTTLAGNVCFRLNEERLLGSWEEERQVEETIGIPYLSEIPYLKYLFSTTTVNYERVFLFLTVTAELPDTAAPAPFQGRIVRVK